MNNNSKWFPHFLRTVFSWIMPKRKQRISTYRNPEANCNKDTQEWQAPEWRLPELRPTEINVSMQEAVVSAPESTPVAVNKESDEIAVRRAVISPALEPIEQDESALFTTPSVEDDTSAEQIHDLPVISSEAPLEEVTTEEVHEVEQEESALFTTAEAEEVTSEEQEFDAPEIANEEPLEEVTAEEVPEEEQEESALATTAEAEEDTSEEQKFDAPEISSEEPLEEVTEEEVPEVEQDESVLSTTAEAEEGTASEGVIDGPVIASVEPLEEATGEEDEKLENKVDEATSNTDDLLSVVEEDTRDTVARERWALLHNEPYHRWSLRRMAALGIPSDYLKNFSTFEKIGDISSEEYPEELADLNEPAWQQALAMCAGWEEILVQHRDALRIAQMQLAHIPDDKICEKLNLLEIGLKTRMEALRKAVVYWSVAHAQAIAFMRDGYKFREIPSKEFFGKTVAMIVQMLLPPPRIMTPWERLERKLYEQVQHAALLGDIELNAEEFELLMAECRVRYRAFMLSENQDRAKDIIMSIGLVQIAIREYQNHTFWPKVAKHFGFAKTTMTLQKLGDVFVRTIADLNKPGSDEGGNVSSIAMHAFASNACIPKLFDFLYDYYAIDASWDKAQLNVDDLCSTIASDSDFPRAYLLYQHTRHAVRAFPQESRHRLQEYLEWIDGAFWNMNYEPEGETRFTEAFKEWRKNHPDLNGSYQLETQHRTGKRRYFHPELRLDMHTGEISLCFPRQHLPLHIQGDVQWHFNNQILPAINCEVVEGVTCLHTQELIVPFPEEHLLSEITCTLKSTDTNLRSFTIAEDCVRIFDRQGMQVTGRHLKQGENYCFVSADAPLKSNGIVDEQPVGRWLMQRCNLTDGDIVFYPDGTVSIVGYDLHEGLCGVTAVDGAYAVTNENEIHDIFPHMPLLFVRTVQERFNNGRLLVNGQYYRLKDLGSQSIELKDRSGETGFLITLPVLHKGASGLYLLRCDIPGENDVRVWRFACMQDFAYRFENDGNPLPYWGVPRGSVTITYPEPLQGQGLVKHPQKNEFGFDILPYLNELCLRPVSDDFSVHLKVPVLAWRMDEQDWRVTPIEEIWLNDLGRNFDFRTSEKEVTLMVDFDALEKGRTVTFSRPQDASVISCDLTQLRTWLTRDRIIHEIYVCVGQRKVLVAKVFCASFLADARLEADYKRGGIHGVFDIIGNGRYAVTVVFEDEIVAEQVPIENNQVFLPLTMNAGTCEATIYEVEDDEFGFGAQLYEMGTARCQLIDPENLCGRRFWLHSITTLNRESVRYEVAYKRYWIDLQRRDEENKHRYYGIMRSSSAVQMGEKMEVIVTVPDRTNISLCQLTFMDDGEEEAFLFDFAKQELVSREPEHLHYMERYRRYSLLDTEDLLQVVYL